jgi:hypothetical protein
MTIEDLLPREPKITFVIYRICRKQNDARPVRSLDYADQVPEFLRSYRESSPHFEYIVVRAITTYETMPEPPSILDSA